MAWIVLAHREFAEEVLTYPDDVREAIVVLTKLLINAGPHLKRPHCDTLKGSAIANLKELRFNADGGVWRVAFAFDPKRQAVLLVCGDKSGADQARFYRTLIRKAEARFTEWNTE